MNDATNKDILAKLEEHFESDSIELKKEFQMLRDHTANHRKMLAEYLEAEKSRS